MYFKKEYRYEAEFSCISSRRFGRRSPHRFNYLAQILRIKVELV
jgi:hypothetical protein